MPNGLIRVAPCVAAPVGRELGGPDRDGRVLFLGLPVLRDLRPGDDLEMPVGVLADRGAAFHPVAAIDVADAEIAVDRGEMDVATDDAVDIVALGLGDQGLLELTDI